MEIRKEFTFHKLNSDGQKKAVEIAIVYSEALNKIEELCSGGADPRLLAIVRSKMEEACFYAKKCMAVQMHNQESINTVGTKTGRFSTDPNDR